jgi:acyl dehydratase
MNEPTDSDSLSLADYAHLLTDLAGDPQAVHLEEIRAVEEGLLSYDCAPAPEHQAQIAQCWHMIATWYRQLGMPDEAYEASYLADAHKREAQKLSTEHES